MSDKPDMNKYSILQRVAAIYKKGGNIIQYLKSLEGNPGNSTEDILISYDFQAGSYIKIADSEFQKNYCSGISKVINSLGAARSIIEVGVGEATTLGNVLKALKNQPKNIFGFDISWSRIKYANHYIKTLNIKNAVLTTGDLFNAPFQSDSIDIVYTAHSIEPNGGREKEALEELYRITNKYLVFIEPSYEHAPPEGKERMEKNGYISNFYSTAKTLGYDVIEHRLFDNSIPLNPSGLTIIKKNTNNDAGPVHLACPISKTPLKKYGNVLFSEDSLLAYPIIDGIPCLLPQNAIIATHFLDKIN
jgi:SAM-dependent methyltransferase